jgi:hypothetical protein
MTIRAAGMCMRNVDFVQATLSAHSDELGDKYAGVVEVHGRKFFYVSSAFMMKMTGLSAQPW